MNRDGPPGYDSRFVDHPKNNPTDTKGGVYPAGGVFSQPGSGYPQPPLVYQQPQPGNSQPQPVHIQLQPTPGYSESTLPQSQNPMYHDPTDPYSGMWGPQASTVSSGTSTFLLGDSPITVTCPSCHHQVLTYMRSTADMRTHTFAMLICVFCIPLLWIPYCFDSCKTQRHFCPECGCFIGMHRT